MAKKSDTLSSALKRQKHLPQAPASEAIPKDLLEQQKFRLFRIQQGLWLRKARAILVFEGFDASGKGGVIRALSENLDPRGIAMHPIGPPDPREQGIHWMYRFWTKLPKPGVMAIFDRSWYGRVLVERVEKLAPREAWKRAYDEIHRFERMLVDDGIILVKFFLAVSKEEQLARFESRLQDPYKQWKLTMEDVRAREQWDAYVEATDEMLEKTHTKRCPWIVVPSDDKQAARHQVLDEVTKRLGEHADWIEQFKDHKLDKKKIALALKQLGKE